MRLWAGRVEGLGFRGFRVSIVWLNFTRGPQKACVDPIYPRGLNAHFLVGFCVEVQGLKVGGIGVAGLGFKGLGFRV